ncbi:MAG: hypothetical protein RR946_12480 [Clostridia bacterium]
MINLDLQPVEMTPQVMQALEDKGCITRLCANHEQLHAPAGQTTWQQMYEPKDHYGPHKLITIRVNRETFAAFGTHPDAEAFWLIGDENTQPMYLAIALLKKQAMEQKIAEQTLSAEDFTLLHIRYNDPLVSFFIMNAEIPHGEAIVDHQQPPAAFYVTESRDLPLHVTDFGEYSLRIKEP